MDKLERILTAIARNQVSTFKKLVTVENVDVVDEDGYTLLANVVLDEDADVEMARHLVRLGAAINRVGAPDEKWTALALALRNGRVEIAKMLLDAGVKVIAKDSSGNTPLHYAMHPLGYDHIPQKPILELIAILLSKGADPRQKNRDGDSPHSMAKLGEMSEVMAMFTNNRSNDKSALKKHPASKSRTAGRKPSSRQVKTSKRAKKTVSAPRKRQ